MKSLTIMIWNFFLNLMISKTSSKSVLPFRYLRSLEYISRSRVTSCPGT